VDLSIVIPCYNEADNVEKIKTELFPVVRKLTETQSVEVVFVDDGSTDDTWQRFTTAFGPKQQTGDFTVRFERHQPNRGLGAAIRTGFAAATGDIIVTTDSDGTYSFSEIPAMLAYLTPDVDIVTASPYHPAGAIKDVPRYRLVLSQGASTIYRLLVDRRIHTFTALFRAYRRQVIEDVPFDDNGFLGVTELLINAHRMGYRVAEYPTVLHSRVHGTSKAKLIRIIKSHLAFQLQVVIPWHPYGALLQASGDSVYLYSDFQKRLFPTADIFLSHGYQWDQVQRVTDYDLEQLITGPPMEFREGSLLKGSDDTVYCIEHGRKRPFLSVEAFAGLGYKWQYILPVPDDALAGLETGPAITAGSRYPDGTLVQEANDKTVYRLENGEKRPFNTAQGFLSWGYRWDQVITLNHEALQSYPTGLSLPPQKSFKQESLGQPATQNQTRSASRSYSRLGELLRWVGVARYSTQFRLKS
jgi:dolichol-phosphate mannosyltransferase